MRLDDPARDGGGRDGWWEGGRAGCRAGGGGGGGGGAGSLGSLRLLCVYLERRCSDNIFLPRPHSYLGHICTYGTFILRARLHLGFFVYLGRFCT